MEEGKKVEDYLYLDDWRHLYRINLSKFLETGTPPSVELVIDVDKTDCLCRGMGFFAMDSKLHCVGGERNNQKRPPDCKKGEDYIDWSYGDFNTHVYTIDHLHRPVLAAHIPPMNSPKLNALTVQVDGKIYVFGTMRLPGTRVAASPGFFEVFDPDKNTWEVLPTPPGPFTYQFYHSVAVWERKIIFWTSLTWTFDTAARTWKNCDPFGRWIFYSQCPLPWIGCFLVVQSKFLFSLNDMYGLVAYLSPQKCQVMHDFNQLTPWRSVDRFFLHRIGEGEAEGEDRLCAVFLQNVKAFVSIFRVSFDQGGECCRLAIDYTHSFKISGSNMLLQNTFISHLQPSVQAVESVEAYVNLEAIKAVTSTDQKASPT